MIHHSHHKPVLNIWVAVFSVVEVGVAGYGEG